MKKQLGAGVLAQVEVSRKSSIPPGVRGEHLVITLSREGLPLEFKEVTDETASEAYSFAKVIAREHSARLGNPGSFRIVENGEVQCSQPNFHIHVIVIASSADELKTLGLEVFRAVDPAGLFKQLKSP